MNPARIDSASSWSIVTKLRLLAAGIIAAVVALSVYNGVAHYSVSVEQRLAATRSVVQQAASIAARYEELARTGQLGQTEAQAKAIGEIKAIRYDGNEYVWVNDMTPRMVVHPIKPELDGKPLGDIKDPSGKRLFVEFVQTVRAGGSGYVDYLWPKPGHADPEPKRSYVAGFAPWGWVIGSGVYIDAVRSSAMRFAAVSLSVGVLVGVGALVCIHLLGRSMQRRLAAAEHALNAMSCGDLTTAVQIDTNDEIGALLRCVVRTRDGLMRMVDDVRSSTESIGTASSQIACGNQDLSARTEQAASNLQETAASMEELTSTVRQTAGSAQTASQLAGAASASAASGCEVAQKVVSTMEGIDASARKIAEITGMIDGIAFQTNLLALNAAVEAARAGEQGRGFAVVAAEVRGLAQRSADAARQIKSLIDASVEQVQQGTNLVRQAGGSMTEIAANVQRVSDIIAEISNAATEQSEGIGQVNAAVTNLDQMTQQNAALVEQSAAAAESLRGQAQRLVNAVSVFRTTAA
jgi:methyl-accepting chemotaxis protein